MAHETDVERHPCIKLSAACKQTKRGLLYNKDVLLFVQVCSPVSAILNTAALEGKVTVVSRQLPYPARCECAPACMQPCCRPPFRQTQGGCSIWKGSRSFGKLYSSARVPVNADSLLQHVVWIRGLPFNLTKTNLEEGLQLCLPSAQVFVKPARSKRADHAGWALAQWTTGAPALSDVEAALAGTHKQGMTCVQAYP
eukprot:1158825-Pelagomonas_calceolata.AAC.9